MRQKRILVTIIAALCLLTATAVSQDPSQKVFDEGRALLDKHEWDDAIEKFDQVIAQGGSRVDAALYWKAYAHDKEGDQSAVLETVQELRKRYPESSYLKEAKVLELKYQSNPERENNEELKLLAINSLLNSDPERAIPLLEKILATNPSDKLKKKALFVLAQSGSPKAREITEKIARDGSNPELQKTAIEHLGVFGGPENRALLSEIYASSTDVGIKKRVLNSFMISGDKARVLKAAEGEQNPDLRREAVNLLGVMGAREDLWRMYQKETDQRVKREIINALFVAGDQDRMGQLAKAEQDPRLRSEAVEKLGLMGEGTAPQLKSIYADSKDEKVRRAVLNAFFLQGNESALIEIARKESDPKMKREAVEKLSIMDSKEAKDFMIELLNQ